MSIIYTKFNQSARIQHRIQTHYFSMCTRVLKSYNIKIKNLATRILHITKPVKIKLPGSGSSQQEPHYALNDCRASPAGKRCPSRCSWERKRVIHLDVHPSSYPSIHMSIQLSIHPSKCSWEQKRVIHPYVHPYIHPSTRPDVPENKRESFLKVPFSWSNKYSLEE